MTWTTLMSTPVPLWGAMLIWTGGVCAGAGVVILLSANARDPREPHP